jgi:hypothetical protein
MAASECVAVAFEQPTNDVVKKRFIIDEEDVGHWKIAG